MHHYIFLSKKLTKKRDIPGEVLKDSIKICSKELTIVINSYLEKRLFLDELKLTDVPTIFKKDKNLNKENYRLVNILSHTSKVFEMLFYKQIHNFSLLVLNILTKEILPRCYSIRHFKSIWHWKS